MIKDLIPFIFSTCSVKYGGGAIRPLPRDGGVEKIHGDSTVGPRPKWRAREAQMQDNPGGELDPAKGVRRLCMKNFPFVLSCIFKRAREGCDCELCTNVSPQRGDAVPAPSYERWAEIARQLSRWVRPSGHPQSSGCFQGKVSLF